MSTVISVVMPAHDEEEFLKPAVTEVAEGMRQRGPFEILIVENGSSDGTAAVARTLALEMPEVRTIHLGRPDYGAAMRTGFLAAGGEFVAVFDVDYFDLGFLDQAVGRLRAGNSAVVVGSKRGPGANDTRSWLRRLVTWVFSSILRWGFGLKLSDTHGIKVLRRDPLVPIAERCRFGTDLFDTELVLRAQRAGLDVEEIPVVVNETRPSRTPIVSRIARTLKGLVRLRLMLWRDRS